MCTAKNFPVARKVPEDVGNDHGCYHRGDHKLGGTACIQLHVPSVRFAVIHLHLRFGSLRTVLTKQPSSILFVRNAIKRLEYKHPEVPSRGLGRGLRVARACWKMMRGAMTASRTTILAVSAGRLRLPPLFSLLAQSGRPPSLGSSRVWPGGGCALLTGGSSASFVSSQFDFESAPPVKHSVNSSPRKIEATPAKIGRYCISCLST